MKIKPLYFTLFLTLFFLIIFVILIIVNQKQIDEKTNWQFFIENKVGAKSVLNVGQNLTFDEKSIYFSDGSGLIHALNKESGQVAWLNQLNDHSPFEITQDQESLYIASFDSHIYKLDKKNGYIIWSFAIPDQFWPDTEVIFDANDSSVFFADRGGFLYALDKTTGQEIWRKEFDTIDNTKTFQEGLIHFGFLSQEENVLMIDHFPSKTIFQLTKKLGKYLVKKTRSLRLI